MVYGVVYSNYILYPTLSGVTFLPGQPPEAAAALALLLFGDPEAEMPGGFSNIELSDNSPIKSIASFPQVLFCVAEYSITVWYMLCITV